MSTTATIERVERVTPELVEQMNHLLPQVSSRKTRLTQEEFENILSNPHVYLFVATLPDKGVVGSVSLATFHTIAGLRAWIEEIVVDEAYRGHGIATQLMQAAITKARDLCARTIDLTSRGDRQADAFYLKLGFHKRETHVYRIQLDHNG